MDVDLTRAVTEARRFLRPIAWRDTTPAPEDLEGCLVFGRERRTRSFDSTQIAYSVYGRRGPWVVLVPGFACPDNFWRYLVPALAGDYRVVVYDLRGLGLSGFPRQPGYRARNLSSEDFSIPNHVRDVQAVLDAEGVPRAALIGHSMGGQIILEAYRRMPRRVSALVSLTAPFESPIRTFYGRDFSGFFRGVRIALNALPRPTVLLWRSLFLVDPTLPHRVAQLLRALGPDAKPEDMEPYYRHMAYLDPLVMLKMAEAMRSHSVADVLATVKVPTLIVAGTLDTFTPIALAESMHEAIRDSELKIIANASHGAVIEKPDEVNAAVKDFLDRRLKRPRRRTPPRKRAAPKTGEQVRRRARAKAP